MFDVFPNWEVLSYFPSSLWQRGGDDKCPSKLIVCKVCLPWRSTVWLKTAVILNTMKIAWSTKFLPERKTSGHWTCKWLTEASHSGFSLNEGAESADPCHFFTKSVDPPIFSFKSETTLFKKKRIIKTALGHFRKFLRHLQTIQSCLR